LEQYIWWSKTSFACLSYMQV